MWHSPSISSIATHPLPDILTLTAVPLKSKCVQRRPNAGHFILSAVCVTIGFTSPPPHTHLWWKQILKQILKRRRRTRHVENDRCRHQLKTPSLTLIGRKRNGEGQPHLGLIPLHQPVAKQIQTQAIKCFVTDTNSAPQTLSLAQL